jgi:hypothetical protein
MTKPIVEYMGMLHDRLIFTNIDTYFMFAMTYERALLMLKPENDFFVEGCYYEVQQ